MLKKKLLISSNNQDKIKEFKEILSSANLEKFEILSSKDFNIEAPEVEETGKTLQENAELKARAFYQTYNICAIADDTGLEVNALDGAPGVYSARYAGENITYADNRNLMLANMKDKTDRNAKFRTVICMFDGAEAKFFDGECRGEIINEAKGDGGFGYDAIFKPLGFEKTFAEMEQDEKNSISHRRQALNNLVKYLQTL